MTPSQSSQSGELWIHFQPRSPSLASQILLPVPELQTPQHFLCFPHLRAEPEQDCRAPGRGELTSRQAEVFSMEGLVQGQWLWPGWDTAIALLMAGQLSQVRGLRVSSVSSV